VERAIEDKLYLPTTPPTCAAPQEPASYEKPIGPEERPEYENPIGPKQPIMLKKSTLARRLIFNEKPSVFMIDEHINHESGTLSEHKNDEKRLIPDEYLDEKLFITLRMGLAPTYPNRASKLDHVNKLANKYLSVNNIKVTNMSPKDVNIHKITIQKVVDMRDDNLLLSEQQQEKCRKQRFTGAWLRAKLARDQSKKTTPASEASLMRQLSLVLTGPGQAGRVARRAQPALAQ
jgi:hypothetical protein